MRKCYFCKQRKSEFIYYSPVPPWGAYSVCIWCFKSKLRLNKSVYNIRKQHKHDLLKNVAIIQ